MRRSRNRCRGGRTSPLQHAAASFDESDIADECKLSTDLESAADRRNARLGVLSNHARPLPEMDERAAIFPRRPRAAVLAVFALSQSREVDRANRHVAVARLHIDAARVE